MLKIIVILCLSSISFFSHPHSGEGTVRRTFAGGCKAYFWKSESMFDTDYFVHVHSDYHETIEVSESRYYYLLNNPCSNTACTYCDGCMMRWGRANRC